MAAAVYTSDLIDIFLFEVTTGVVAWNITGGGGAGLGADPDYAVEGTNAVGKQNSAGERGFMFGAAGAFVIGPNDHYMIWIIVSTFGLADLRDDRGICQCMGVGVADYVQFHVNGGDTLPLGGTIPYPIRYNDAPFADRRTITGTPTAAPDHIGMTSNITGTARFENNAIDAARVGTGYSVTGGTSADPEATFLGVATNDASTAEGILVATDGGFKLQGKLRVGESGAECELLDLNTNILVVGNLQGHVLRNFSEVIVSDDLTIFTLTNVNFEALSTWDRGRLEMVIPLIDAQDETSYDGSPSTEGSFAAGTGYSVADVITLSDGYTKVTVDTLSGSAVATFTVDATKGRTVVDGETLTQVISIPAGGTGFTLTAGVDNIVSGVSDLAFSNVGFVSFGETIFASTAELLGCRWIGSDRVEAKGGTFTNSTVSNFEAVPLTDAHDETDYDGSPSTEGSFNGGTGYAVSDIIELSNGALVTVDAITGVDEVSEFTLSSDVEFDFGQEGVALTQLNVIPVGGTGFTLTPEIDNLEEKASMLWGGNNNPNGSLDGMIFTKGDNPSHAIEFADDIPSSITLTDVELVGYNVSDGEKDSALWFRDTGGTITVNVSGGTTPTFKTDGATIDIVADVTLTFTNLKDLSEIRVYTAGTTTELAGVENATDGSPDARTFNPALPGGTSVDIMIHSVLYETIRFESFTWPSVNQSLPINQRFDRNNNNPP